MRRRRRPAHELRTAIDCLPPETRRAMLDGIAANRIIVGAYVDRKGGVCPMLAAHRNGGRTSLASFARAWDRYTRAGGRARPATERELRTLTVMLEASLALEDWGGAGELGRAISEHRAARGRHDVPPPVRESVRSRPSRLLPPEVPRRRRPRRDTGERYRYRELRRREGWAWLRPFRRLDAYEQALRDLERARSQERPPERERELV